MLFTNLKVLLSRAWQTLAHLDSRLTKSAAGGAAVSIFTGLLIGAFSGCFSEDKDGPRPPEPASRAQYAVFAASFACLEGSLYSGAALRSTHEAQHRAWLERWRSEKG